ncbi:MAG TPA: hypothetical protein VFP11_17000 [Candidatus Angelobacter sp.]|nr:hypothetical protein [Candidatus Angelobacter sp.]
MPDLGFSSGKSFDKNNKFSYKTRWRIKSEYRFLSLYLALEVLLALVGFLFAAARRIGIGWARRFSFPFQGSRCSLGCTHGNQSVGRIDGRIATRLPDGNLWATQFGKKFDLAIGASRSHANGGILRLGGRTRLF